MSIPSTLPRYLHLYINTMIRHCIHQQTRGRKEVEGYRVPMIHMMLGQILHYQNVVGCYSIYLPAMLCCGGAIHGGASGRGGNTGKLGPWRDAGTCARLPEGCQLTHWLRWLLTCTSILMLPHRQWSSLVTSPRTTPLLLHPSSSFTRCQQLTLCRRMCSIIIQQKRLVMDTRCAAYSASLGNHLQHP